MLWSHRSKNRRRRRILLVVLSGVFSCFFLFQIVCDSFVEAEETQKTSSLFEYVPAEDVQSVRDVLPTAGASSVEIARESANKYREKLKKWEESFVSIAKEELTARKEEERLKQELEEKRKQEEQERHKKVVYEKQSVSHIVIPADGSTMDYFTNVLNAGVSCEDFLMLCATVHLEAGMNGTLESKCAVANVITNRVKNKHLWKYSTIPDAIYAPSQFSVYKDYKFKPTMEKFASGSFDGDMQNTLTACTLALQQAESYSIPDDVYYFYGDPNKRIWGSHVYCFTIGGNSFFK